MNDAAIGKFDKAGDKTGKSTGIETPVPMPVAASPLISAREVDKSFHDAGREVVVLRGLDLEVMAGEEVAIIGQSGVGKSTLLHVIGSLERPTGGQVLFEGHDLFAMDERETAEFRNRNLGFVFQFHYLLADFSALENVMMPALIARLPDRQARDMAASVLERVGLKDKGHRRAGGISRGGKTR